MSNTINNNSTGRINLKLISNNIVFICNLKPGSVFVTNGA